MPTMAIERLFKIAQFRNVFARIGLDQLSQNRDFTCSASSIIEQRVLASVPGPMSAMAILQQLQTGETKRP